MLKSVFCIVDSMKLNYFHRYSFAKYNNKMRKVHRSTVEHCELKFISFRRNREKKTVDWNGMKNAYTIINLSFGHKHIEPFKFSDALQK